MKIDLELNTEDRVGQILLRALADAMGYTTAQQPRWRLRYSESDTHNINLIRSMLSNHDATQGKTFLSIAINIWNSLAEAMPKNEER